jgi:hypothetical protein
LKRRSIEGCRPNERTSERAIERGAILSLKKRKEEEIEGDNEQRSEIEREREREKELCVSLSCFGCFSCSSSFFSLSTVREIQCRKRIEDYYI